MGNPGKVSDSPCWDISKTKWNVYLQAHQITERSTTLYSKRNIHLLHLRKDNPPFLTAYNMKEATKRCRTHNTWSGTQGVTMCHKQWQSSHPVLVTMLEALPAIPSNSSPQESHKLCIIILMTNEDTGLWKLTNLIRPQHSKLSGSEFEIKSTAKT